MYSPDSSSSSEDERETNEKEKYRSKYLAWPFKMEPSLSDSQQTSRDICICQSQVYAFKPPYFHPKPDLVKQFLTTTNILSTDISAEERNFFREIFQEFGYMLGNPGCPTSLLPYNLVFLTYDEVILNNTTNLPSSSAQETNFLFAEFCEKETEIVSLPYSDTPENWLQNFRSTNDAREMKKYQQTKLSDATVSDFPSYTSETFALAANPPLVRHRSRRRQLRHRQQYDYAEFQKLPKQEKLARSQQYHPNVRPHGRDRMIYEKKFTYLEEQVKTVLLNRKYSSDFIPTSEKDKESYDLENLLIHMLISEYTDRLQEYVRVFPEKRLHSALQQWWIQHNREESLCLDKLKEFNLPPCIPETPLKSQIVANFDPEDYPINPTGHPEDLAHNYQIFRHLEDRTLVPVDGINLNPQIESSPEDSFVFFDPEFHFWDEIWKAILKIWEYRRIIFNKWHLLDMFPTYTTRSLPNLFLRDAHCISKVKRISRFTSKSFSTFTMANLPITSFTQKTQSMSSLEMFDSYEQTQSNTLCFTGLPDKRQFQKLLRTSSMPSLVIK